MPPERRQLDLRRAAAALADADREPATMDAIARALGLAKPTLYRLTGGRGPLVEACVDAEAERLLEHLHGGWPDVESAVEGFATDSPGGFRLLFGGRIPEARAATRRVEDRLRELLRHDDRGDDRDGRDPSLVAAGLVGRAVAMTRRRMEDGAPI